MKLPGFIANLVRPTPLSPAWLEAHCVRLQRKDYQAHAHRKSGRLIYHVTDSSKAMAIIESRCMYGTDGNEAAHFHFQLDSAHRQAEGKGMVLGFCWQGEVKRGLPGLHEIDASLREPNVLFDIATDDHGNGTWELRLYPGTKGLLLEYIEFEAASSGYNFLQPLPISIRRPEELG
ncbi:MAG TPA: hypothetical protein VD810_03190 [Methylophilaceae bacterium]|nr:hypothetical protein [Methylophilaceae bacterium]